MSASHILDQDLRHRIWHGRRNGSYHAVPVRRQLEPLHVGAAGRNAKTGGGGTGLTTIESVKSHKVVVWRGQSYDW